MNNLIRIKKNIVYSVLIISFFSHIIIFDARSDENNSKNKVLLPSINEHTKDGFEIINVTPSDGLLVYTLIKENEVIVCNLMLGSDKVLNCSKP